MTPLTCDQFRVAAQDVHEGAHGRQLSPEAAQVKELWLAEQNLLGIRVEPGQTGTREETNSLISNSELRRHGKMGRSENNTPRPNPALTLT